jgi:hypothetical protein
MNFYRSIGIAIITVACYVTAHAQADTLLHANTQRMMVATDTLKPKVNRILDKVDSVNVKIANALSGGKQAPVQAVDSLQASLMQKVEASRTRLSWKIDSLTQLELPTDSYRSELDSLNNLHPLQKIEDVQNELSDVDSKLKAKVNEPLDGVNKKLGLLNGESEGLGNLPGNVDVDLPAANFDVIPASPQIDVPKFPDATNLSEHLPAAERLDGLPSADVTGKLQPDLSGASEVSENVSTYTNDVRNITEGDFDDVTELDKDVLEATDMKELDVLQEQQQALQSHQNAIRSMRNQEEFKKQTLARAREIVELQLATNTGKLDATLAKVSRHQQRVSSIFNKAKQLPKRPRKAAKPPLIERFVPGITVQVQRNDLWHIDLNPHVRYRIRSIWSTGLGWNERIVFDDNFRFNQQMRVYGFRAFSELSILQGLSVRADAERLSAFVPLSRAQHDVGERKQVWSYMAGIKKEFSFAPGVSGNVQFMYNLYDPGRTSPYFNRFNVRFGFEFPLKRKSSKK